MEDRRYKGAIVHKPTMIQA